MSVVVRLFEDYTVQHDGSKYQKANETGIFIQQKGHKKPKNIITFVTFSLRITEITYIIIISDVCEPRDVIPSSGNV
jgi:hypothetical protein